MLSKNIFSLNFCPPQYLRPKFLPPNIYDKFTPLAMDIIRLKYVLNITFTITITIVILSITKITVW